MRILSSFVYNLCLIPLLETYEALVVNVQCVLPQKQSLAIEEIPFHNARVISVPLKIHNGITVYRLLLFVVCVF